MEMRRVRFIIGAALTTLLSLAVCANANRDLPDNNLAYPVLIVIDNASSGSGFFRNKSGNYYLVTARHVLFEKTAVELSHALEGVKFPENLRHRIIYSLDREKSQWRIEFLGKMSITERNQLLNASPENPTWVKAIDDLYKKSQHPKLKGKVAIITSCPNDASEQAINELELNLEFFFKANNILCHDSFDITALRLGRTSAEEDESRIVFDQGIRRTKGAKCGFVSVADNSFKLFNGALVGNPVFMFGYPTSLAKTSPYLDIKKPLVRKGIIAGKNETLRTIILDCPVHPGDSGGLVIEEETLELARKQFLPIGIATNIIPFIKEPFLETSGYSVAVPMDALEELISSQ